VSSSLPDLREPLDGACAPLDPLEGFALDPLEGFALDPLEAFALDPLEVAVDPLELLRALCDVPVGDLSNAGEEVETILPLRGGCFDG
jgi:hypothetical protein